MSQISTALVRCRWQADHQCKKAGGYAFLVFDWLPWTTKGMCRECARFAAPQLITQAAFRVQGALQLVIDNSQRAA
ncbi:hypothetical protein G1E_09592 [Pseudomonas sp. TJI-51]|nr:hypothetical protein G1E_09592 [Pseudomonas sp. TJI-51]